MNLYQRIYDAASTAWEEDAFRLPGGTSLSHREVHNSVSRCAGVLRDAGVIPGDRVTVQVAKSVENVVLYLAVLRLGAIYQPLNTSYTKNELDFFIGDAKPRVMVVDPQNSEELQPLAVVHDVAALFTLDDKGEGTLMGGINDTKPFDDIVERSDDDVAAILYTSGTTGRSKGAMLTNNNLYTNAAALRKSWGWTKDDILLHSLPIYHVHGLFVALHCALLEPSPIIFLPHFNEKEVLENLKRSTVYMGVPTHYTRLLSSQGLDAEICRGMRLFTSGSAPLLRESFEKFQQQTGHRILERYGMTEAGMITSNPLEGGRIPGTVGFPLPGVEIRLRTPEGEPVPEGEVGVLEIRSPGLFKGYWGMPDKTQSEFRDGWFITGDLAKVDSTGRVTLAGRHKDLIISGGLNIYPKEVESHINSEEGIVESAVIGVPHHDFGEGVVAVVVTTDEWPGEASLIARLRKKLAGFKVPKKVFSVDSLPRNAMGKIQKNQLREKYSNVFLAE